MAKQTDYALAAEYLASTGTGGGKVATIIAHGKQLSERTRGEPSIDDWRGALEGHIPAATLERFLHVLENGIPKETEKVSVKGADLAKMRDVFDRAVNRFTEEITELKSDKKALEERVAKLEAFIVTLRAPENAPA